MESIYYTEEASQGATWQGRGQGVGCGAGGLHLLCIEAGANVENGTVGNARVIEHGYKLAHADFRTIFCGDPMIGNNFITNFPPRPTKKVHLGSRFLGAGLQIDIPRSVRLMKADKFKLDLHTDEFMLEQSNEATDVVRSVDAGRVLVAMAQRRH